ncbi:MAG: M48 family metallopeptidase [Myxococcales bacterium]|nr:M48 family metallopeptidase [Myxococcales bacterium]
MADEMQPNPFRPSEPRPAAPTEGFGHSRRRLALEIGGAVVVLALLIWGAFALASWGAGLFARFVPASAEIALGENTWDRVAPPSAQCTDPAALAYVEQLAAPLLAQIDSPYDFQFRVVDDDSINAFALPGGFVTVHYGLLQAAESGEEVAAVLAHEMQHVLQRHGLKRILHQLGGWTLLGTVLGFADLSSLTGVAMSLVGHGYDRDQERESDALGRALLKRAHIDPRGMATFFDRMAEEDAGNGLPAILSTHPGSEERAAAARAEGPFVGEAITLPSPKGVKCK